jgi:hypothetical protein
MVGVGAFHLGVVGPESSLGLIEIYRTPIERSFKDIEGLPITTLLCGGIVNPFGPTMNVCAAIGEIRADNILPIVQIMLNPFTQWINQIGRATIGRKWWSPGHMEPLLNLRFGSCPTLLLSSSLLESDQAIALHARWLGRFPDAGIIWQSIMAHPGDPWTRIQAQIAATPAFGENITTRLKDQEVRISLDESEARKFSEYVLSSDHMRPEFQAFCLAWDGSIEFQRNNGNSHLALEALDLEKFKSALSPVILSCRLPQ